MATIIVTSATWSSKGKILEATEELRNSIKASLQKVVDEGAGEALNDPAKALFAAVKAKVYAVVRDVKEENPVAALVTKDLSIQLEVEGSEPLAVYSKEGILSVGSDTGYSSGYGRGFSRYPAYQYRTFPASSTATGSAAVSAAAFQDAWDELNDKELWDHYYR